MKYVKINNFYLVYFTLSSDGIKISAITEDLVNHPTEWGAPKFSDEEAEAIVQLFKVSKVDVVRVNDNDNPNYLELSFSTESC